MSSSSLVCLTSLFLLLRAAAAAAQTTAPPRPAAELFQKYCSRCHGREGKPAQVPASVKTRPYDFTKCSVSSAEPDTAWRLAVAHGGPAVGLSDDMPAFRGKLADDEIAAVVTHLRSRCVDEGWPNGNLNLSRPILTEKAFPEDEVVVLPSIMHRKSGATEGELAAVVEKRIGKRLNVELEIPFSTVASGEVRESGFGDIELAVKGVLFSDRPGTRILSAGLEMAFPTGSESRGLGEGTTRFEPFVAAAVARGLTSVQGTLSVEIPKGAPAEDREFGYNVFVGHDLDIDPRRWTLGIELNGENTELALTPQVRKGLVKTGALAAAFGVQFPLTERDEAPVRLVGYLLWDYREPIWRRPPR